MGGLSLQIDIQLPVAEEIPAPAGYGMGGQRLVLRAQGDMYRDKVHHVVQVPLIHDGLGAIERLLGRLEEELDLSLQLPFRFISSAAMPKPIAVCPSWPQACTDWGLQER